MTEQLYYNSSTMEQKEKILKTFNFQIDSNAAMPVYEQIKQEIKLLITSGHLEGGDQLPPIRELAVRLKVNTNTIVKVYYQLDVEKFIYSQPGSGYFVREDRAQHWNEEKRQELFGQITEEYIAKALKLGFALDDMINKLKDRGIGGGS